MCRKKTFLLWLLATVNLTAEDCGEGILEQSAAVEGDTKSFSVPGPVYTNVVREMIVRGFAFQCLPGYDHESLFVLKLQICSEWEVTDDVAAFTEVSEKVQLYKDINITSPLLARLRCVCSV